MIDCLETLKYLDEYTDRELTGQQLLLVKEHLEACPGCTRRFNLEKSVKEFIRVSGSAIEDTSYLKERIKARLAQESLPENQDTRFIIRHRFFLAIAATVLLVFIGWYFFSRPTGIPDLVTKIIEEHQEYEGEDWPQIASSEPVVLQRAFRDKLGFSPKVEDFTRPGYQLLGGWTATIVDRPAAIVCLKITEKFVSVTVMRRDHYPAPGPLITPIGSKECFVTRHKDYHLIYWQDAEYSYSVVSTVDFGTLSAFVASFY